MTRSKITPYCKSLGEKYKKKRAEEEEEEEAVEVLENFGRNQLKRA